MHGRRFDDFVRFTTSGSRRLLLRGLTGAFLADTFHPMRGSAKGQGLVVLGGACTAAPECRLGGPGGFEAALCEDNGIASDGPLNCCGDEFSCCESDDECCGDRRCAPTGDVCSVCRTAPFPSRGLGQPCDADDQCIPYPPNASWAGCVDGRCANSVYPDPEPRPISDAEAALFTAEALSALEATGRFDDLYDRLHPDAGALVPRSAVVGWYGADFAPRGPRTAEAIKVRFVPWTWPVTGQTYPETAEVAYRQVFADGTVVRDEVRLVRNQAGEWSWFFGRDRAFVDEQIARFGAESSVPSALA